MEIYGERKFWFDLKEQLSNGNGKEKKRKKPKNKNIKANLQDEFVKKGDENEYLGNQNIKIIIYRKNN